VQESPLTNGTDIANKIIVIMKERNIKVDFKNVQRRVYDALNVLSALDIITKGGRSKIMFKGNVEHTNC
jgi:N-methylhydantoinase B/oxoprolinase/acetone carboxylase alpha subunit